MDWAPNPKKRALFSLASAPDCAHVVLRMSGLESFDEESVAGLSVSGQPLFIRETAPAEDLPQTFCFCCQSTWHVTCSC
jgi:hypothetical protein